MSNDITVIICSSLVLAVLVASCLRKSDGQAATGGPNRGGQPQQQRRASRGAGPVSTMPRRELSSRALQLQKELGIPYGSAVTISTIGVLLERSSGIGGGFGVVKEALEVLRVLMEFADVFLITQVEEPQGEQESSILRQLLKDTGCILRPQHVPKTDEGIAEHKLLFCNTAIGRQAIVRQLRPQLHIDRDEELLRKLVPYIPRLLWLDASFTGRPDSVPYKVLPALHALLPSTSS